MPIYEYQCGACEHVFDHLARNSREPAPDCPQCGTPEPRKRFATFTAVSSGPPPACGSCPGNELPPSRSPCAAGSCPYS